MIQFKRGSTENLRLRNILLDKGQPGFDKSKHKLKVGDGVTPWKDLPYTSGLFWQEVFDTETSAKARLKADKEDRTVISYGTADPDNNMAGHVYLQHYNAEPETDYVVSHGKHGIWNYQIWHSGIMKCWGTHSVSATVNTKIEGSSLYYNKNTFTSISYPATFKSVPTESVTLQGPGNFCWAANTGANSKTTTGKYSIMSTDNIPSGNFKLSITVEGFVNK